MFHRLADTRPYGGNILLCCGVSVCCILMCCVAARSVAFPEQYKSNICRVEFLFRIFRRKVARILIIVIGILVYSFCRYNQHVLLKLAKSVRVPYLATSLCSRRNDILFHFNRSFKSSTMRHEHSHDMRKQWIVEKAISGLMVPLVPAALMLQNKIVDTVLAVFIASHAFWGLEALVVEYARVLVVGSLVPKLCMLGVYGLTLLLVGGLYFLIFNDIGLTKGFLRIWKNMRKRKGDKHKGDKHKGDKHKGDKSK